MAVRSASATAVTSPYDPTQLPLGCFTPHSDSQTKRSPAANALPALTIAAAAAIAFPIKRGRNGDASRENENANDSDVAKPGSESAAKDRTAEYDHESTNCLSHGAFATYPWGPVLHGLMLIGSGLEVLQQYFSRLTQQLQGANGGVSAGSLRAENGTKLLWFVLQCHLKIVCSAVNQAVGMARLTKVYSSDRLETKQNMQPVERDHSSEAAGVHEKHADGERNIFAGGWTWATHCAASCQKALVGGVAETAKYSSGARFYPGQPKLLDTNVAYTCLRKLGVGGHWVPHWEAIAQRELEEVIFTAVTAAASAAGPTYVKFLQVYRAYLLLSNEASEKSKRTFLDHAFVLGGSLSKSAAAEIGSGDKLPPVAVAVKVMRPGVREAMEFGVLVYRSVEEFAVAMRRQLDFGLEEKHLKLFRANFGLSTIPLPDDLLPMRNRCRRASRPRQCEAPMEDGKAEQKAEQYHTNILGSLSRKILGMRRQVTFPYPFEALSSSEVIVMTLESGFTLNQLFKIRAEPEELEESPRNQRDLREDRGLAMTKREQGDSPVSFPSLAAKKIIELIFPVLPATLPSRLLTNVPHFDALAMLQRAKRSSCQDKEGFCSEVEQLIDEHHFEEGNSLQMSRVRLTSLMGHMLSVSKKYCVELDPSFVSIVVAMSVLEGVGAQLCPDADVLKAALPYSLMAAKLLNPDSSRKA
ncbi:hypothetical protein, conserved [Eimeria acervulina]|uniref:Uncharacterized protein n=1 Tax=Eimeria acervulina TaxID=5801 RepID=U6GVV4_EIMAC|nr:hypothetical protein, conserved [Eimeria acervulina]CDI83413.1 hypothetical protein, conserved [Eimeria acervulina]